MLLPPLLLLLILLFGGVAVFMALGMTALVMLLRDGHTLGGIAQIAIDRMNSPTLTAIPFFVIAATFMQRGGLAEAMVAAAEAWLGRLRGGLALVAVVGAALFASVSGSSTATALALGTVLLPAMIARGYPLPFGCGVVAGSATLGILLPPSLALIIYGIVAMQPVPKLFLAGVVPAMIQAALFTGWILFATRRMTVAGPPGEITIGEKLQLTVAALPALAPPFIALGGIYSGIVTLNEAAALAALAAIAICWQRGAARGHLIEWTADAIRSSSSILIIVSFAVLLGHWIVLSGVPQVLIAGLQSAQVSALEFLLMMNLIMFVLGMFLEVVSVILITLPIVLPLLAPLGIHPIHYAIVVIVNMELAALTPPVGLNLFVMTSVAKTQLWVVVRGLLPFVALLLVLLALVTLVPSISLWLPGAL